MTQPHDDDTADAGLSQVTDEQWLVAHEALVDLGGIPPEELSFVWEPDLDGKALIEETEIEEAPRG